MEASEFIQNLKKYAMYAPLALIAALVFWAVVGWMSESKQEKFSKGINMVVRTDENIDFFVDKELPNILENRKNGFKLVNENGNGSTLVPKYHVVTGSGSVTISLLSNSQTFPGTQPIQENRTEAGE